VQRYNDLVHTMKRGIAAAEILLLLPAALFMASLVVRLVGSAQAEPARSAQQVVTWYSGRIWTLWILLMLLPLAALLIGGAALLASGGSAFQARQWRLALRSDGALRTVAVATLAACAILAVVAVHVLMN
jgi:hypothetical protein